MFIPYGYYNSSAPYITNAIGGDTIGTFVSGGITYKYHQFTSTTTSSFQVLQGFTYSASVLVLAGGGGGGVGDLSRFPPIAVYGGGGAGGGAGGLIVTRSVYLDAREYEVVVGGGGASATQTWGNFGSRTGGKGSNSYISSSIIYKVAVGGGGGVGSANGDGSQTGQGGGSGGGAVNTGTGGSGVSGQGNSGGGGSSVTFGGVGGGGGGAGETGHYWADSGGYPDTRGMGGGGFGLQYNFNGTDTYYAGGGAGDSSNQTVTGSAGGFGGGGSSNGSSSKNGTNELGGGGAAVEASYGSSATSGYGGSGRIIIIYPNFPQPEPAKLIYKLASCVNGNTITASFTNNLLYSGSLNLTSSAVSGCYGVIEVTSSITPQYTNIGVVGSCVSCSYPGGKTWNVYGGTISQTYTSYTYIDSNYVNKSGTIPWGTTVTICALSGSTPSRSTSGNGTLTYIGATCAS